MAGGSPILESWVLDGKGGGRLVKQEDLGGAINGPELLWVHVDAGHPDAPDILDHTLTFLDDLTVEALTADVTRPRMTEIGNGLLLILRGVNFNDAATPEDMVSIRAWFDPLHIVTVRRRRSRTISDIRERLKQGDGPRDAGHFLAMMTDRLLERMEPVLARLDDQADATERSVFEDGAEVNRKTIYEMRQQAISYRRTLAPQRDVISQLRHSNLSWLTPRDRRVVKEGYETISRYLENLDANQERGRVIMDELANTTAAKLNRNLFVLSIISAIFLPLSVLTGLFGMNVVNIPHATDPDMFWNICAGMGIVAVAQVIIFKLLRWF